MGTRPYAPALVKVDVADKPLAEVEADLAVVLLFQGEDLPDELGAAPGAADAKGGYRKATVLYPERPGRVAVVGLGKREDFEPERARVAAALAAKRAGALKATSIAIKVPDTGGDQPEVAAALVEGAILAGYRFDRFKSKDADEEEKPEAPQADEAPPDPEESAAHHVESVTLLGSADLAERAEVARIAAEAANRARNLQDLPGNVATPSYLAERALELAATHERLSCEVMDRDEMVERGMGGLEAVSAGSDQPPKLITLRLEGNGETIGLVGKGVTFDSGGISIKPSAGMQEMKMDMSGASAVIETMGAIAELDLPVSLIAVIPSTENMPSGGAVKPGDIISQLNGKTVEVNNTDAEGRLILADALCWAVEQGAERLVDLATLTGAVLVALGSTYAALISNDDEWADSVGASADATGELAWRLPLHQEYKELTKGTAADLTNAAAQRKAGTIYAASFLEEFVDGRPWVHLDIAGTAWDVGREYVGKGPTGYGVRLLVDLARSL
jgi:leucyl aminopeptidase